MTGRTRESLTLSLLALLCACGPAVAGSGRAAEDQRTVGAWRTLSVASGVHATVTRGAPGVTLSGDDNLLPLVETVVEGTTLHVRLRDQASAWPKLTLAAQVSGEVLEGVAASGSSTVDGSATPTGSNPFRVDASGSSRVTLSAVDASAVRVTASGASNVVVAGRADTLDAFASGSSNIVARELPVDRAQVDGSGASSLELTVRSRVDGSLSGSSRLTLRGGASSSVSASGGSTVTTN